MITNIDENFGRLRSRLAELKLEENTILIFMTDNGSSGGCGLDQNQFPVRGYNAGMRGKKASYYEGGHRVPFFIRWPAAGIQGGCTVEDMALDIDMLPTFMDLCGMTHTNHQPFDGRSFAPLLRGEAELLPERVHFLNILQSTDPPRKEQGCVMTPRWRLVHGSELYDIKADPGQRNDVAAGHPEVLHELKGALNAWWAEVSPTFSELCPIVLGNDAENPTRLCSMDVMGDVAWNQMHIAAAQRSTGRWTVKVEKAGQYRFALRRWPDELGLPIKEPLSREATERLAPYGATIATPEAIHPVRARIKIAGMKTVLPVLTGAQEVVFELDLPETTTTLDAWFIDKDGEERGAYYVVVEYINSR